MDDPSLSDPRQRPATHSKNGGKDGNPESEPPARAQARSLQDRLLEKLLQRLVPADGGVPDGGLVMESGPAEERRRAFARRPNFNITTMSNNFRRFNSRIGLIFRFQDQVMALLGWRRPSQTLACLAVYTFVCLDPSLAAALPLALLVVSVFVPAFLARRPPPPPPVPRAPPPPGSALAASATAAAAVTSDTQWFGYSPHGPPLAPALTVRPVKEFSRDFFSNIRDLQNSMEDFSGAYDAVATALVPLTNFSNEPVSSALFVLAVLAGLALTLTGHLVPWRLVWLATGWAAVGCGHPAAARAVAGLWAQHGEPRRRAARAWLFDCAARDVILDPAAHTREVEMFELQRRSRGGDWEPWLFSPSPYDPPSRPRAAGHRPRGTRFFEDVLPPAGWDWSEKKWALDLWSRDWVEDRIITGVEVEVEGERWVYDVTADPAPGPGPGPAASAPACDGARADEPGRRGDWRRRRWVRLVKRKKIGV